MIAWDAPAWWRWGDPIDEHVKFAQQIGEAVGYGVITPKMAIDMLYDMVRSIKGGPPELPPFGRWKYCRYLVEMRRHIDCAKDFAAADLHRQETYARKVIGPALARGALKPDFVGLIKRDCPDVMAEKKRRIVDEEAAWWVRHRHDLQQTARNLAEAEIAADEAAWRAQCVREDMEIVFG